MKMFVFEVLDSKDSEKIACTITIPTKDYVRADNIAYEMLPEYRGIRFKEEISVKARTPSFRR